MEPPNATALEPSRPSPRRRATLYWGAVFIGFVLLVIAPFVVLTWPIWLLVFIPILFPWAVWLLNEYWRWVRRLGQ